MVALAHFGVDVNICARNEHIPDVESGIRTLKERMRSTFNALPYKKIPARMVIEMVYNAIYWINAVPAADGVSNT